MNKPTKPNITIPESFATNGVKADFDNNKILNGFDRIQPDVLAGDNLNKFIDDTYKASNYALNLGDYVLGHNQITNCILEAPNGVATTTSSSITLKKGLKVLMPNGLNTDGTLKNIEYTLLVDTVATWSAGSTSDGQLILHSNGTVEVMWLTLSICAFFNLKTESEKPTATIPARAICFVKDTNKHYLTTDNGSTWTEILCCSNLVQVFNVGNGVLTAFDANKPISLASTNSDNLFTGYNTFMPNRGNLNTDAFSIVIPKAMTEQKTTHGNILFKNFDNANVCLIGGSQGADGHSAVRILGFHPTNGWKTLFYADTTQDTAWVVEKYSNGQSWYRKWSDGWVEQGSVVGGLSETAFTTVSLLVPVQQSTVSYSISLAGAGLMTGNNVASAFGYMDVGTNIKLAISDFGGAGNNVACFQVWGVMA